MQLICLKFVIDRTAALLCLSSPVRFSQCLLRTPALFTHAHVFKPNRLANWALEFPRVEVCFEKGFGPSKSLQNTLGGVERLVASRWEMALRSTSEISNRIWRRGMDPAVILLLLLQPGA